jgi:hypothetical protein
VARHHAVLRGGRRRRDADINRQRADYRRRSGERAGLATALPLNALQRVVGSLGCCKDHNGHRDDSPEDVISSNGFGKSFGFDHVVKTAREPEWTMRRLRHGSPQVTEGRFVTRSHRCRLLTLVPRLATALLQRPHQLLRAR